MKDNAVSSRTREVADEVEALRRTIEERMPIPAAEPRGYITEPHRPRALELGLRLCVHAETGDSLAQRLKVVPAEYIDRAPDGRTMVRCICGAEHERAELIECPGSCGRWFIGDESGVWAVKLPEAVGEPC